LTYVNGANAGEPRMVIMNRVVLAALRLMSAAPLVLQLSARVSADETLPAPPGYPPGWNVHTAVAPALYDFRSGCWNDYKRYWPEETDCGSTSSRPLPPTTKVIYQFKVGSDHYEDGTEQNVGRFDR